MQDEMVIRDVEPLDVEAVVAIAVAAWAPIYASYRGIMGDDLFAAAHADWQAKKAADVRAACRPGHGAQVCVAQIGGEVEGFATFRADNDSGVGELGNNAVRPDCQGKGIGTALYEQVFDRLEGLGMRYVKVGTGGDPAHAPARRAYEKAGFSIELPGVVYFRAV